MIGLTLVSFVAVFGKGLLASDESALRKQLGTSHVITSQSGWDTVPLGAGEAAANADGVTVSSSIRGDQAQIVGDGERAVSGVDPATIAGRTSSSGSKDPASPRRTRQRRRDRPRG